MEYVEKMVQVFQHVKRVLKDDGTLWVNIGDSYVASACGIKAGGVSKASKLNGSNSEKYRKTLAGGHSQAIDKTKFGLPPKNLIGIPWRVAFALQDDGWILRQDCIWAKGVSGEACKAGWCGSVMPESVSDRFTRSHEYMFLLSKSEKYHFNQQREKGVYPAGTKGGKGSGKRNAEEGVNSRPAEYKVYDGFRNMRDVWTIGTKPSRTGHYASYPIELITPCILAGSDEGGTVLDPFGGSGTTAVAAMMHKRNAILCELNPDYCKIAEDRIQDFVNKSESNQLEFQL